MRYFWGIKCFHYVHQCIPLSQANVPINVCHYLWPISPLMHTIISSSNINRSTLPINFHHENKGPVNSPHKWPVTRKMFSFDSVIICSDLFRNVIYKVNNTGHVVPTMTSSNANIFRVTGLLCGEFPGHRGIPRTKASDAELWFFLWSAPE